MVSLPRIDNTAAMNSMFLVLAGRPAVMDIREGYNYMIHMAPAVVEGINAAWDTWQEAVRVAEA